MQHNDLKYMSTFTRRKYYTPKYRFIKLTNLINNNGDVLTIVTRVEPHNGKIAGVVRIASLKTVNHDVTCKNKRRLQQIHNQAIKVYNQEGYYDYQY